MTLGERIKLEERLDGILNGFDKAERLRKMMFDFEQCFDIVNNQAAREFYAELHEHLVEVEKVC